MSRRMIYSIEGYRPDLKRNSFAVTGETLDTAARNAYCIIKHEEAPTTFTIDDLVEVVGNMELKIREVEIYLEPGKRP